MTELLNFEDKQCIDILLSENVLAFPTETVFGFGVVFDSEKAFETMCLLKGRRPDQPFTIMVNKKDDISLFVDLNDKMKRLIDKFMPGEITILFPRKEGLYPWLTLGSKYVGIRIPYQEHVLSLIGRVNKPLLVTSANMSGSAPLLNHDDVLNTFNNKILGIVKGKANSTVPSTIVMIDNDEIKLIRKGNIKFEDIKEAWEK